MRTFKLVIIGLAIAVIGLFIRENLLVFKKTLPFTFNYYIGEPASWTHSLYSILLFVGILGFLLGIFLMLKPYFKARRLLARERQEGQERLDRQVREQASGSQSTPSPAGEKPEERSDETSG